MDHHKMDIVVLRGTKEGQGHERIWEYVHCYSDWIKNNEARKSVRRLYNNSHKIFCDANSS